MNGSSRPTRRSRSWPAFAVALWCAAPSAQAEGPPAAQDTGDLEALLGESVVTTASRTAERASVAPATVFNITSAEMRAAGVRTVDEALERLGLGVYVAKVRDYTSGIDVGAQGLLFRDASRHVLVLLDGVVLNSQGTGRVSVHEGIGVPIDLVDHIEVMLGPGSVAYGSNAMLGVINVVTKRARDLGGVYASAELGSALPQDDRGGVASGDGAKFGLRYHLALGAGGKFKLGDQEGEIAAMADWTQERSASYGVTPFTSDIPGNQSQLPDQATYGGNAFHRLRAPSGVVTVRWGDFRLLVNAFDYYRNMPIVGLFNDPTARERQTGLRLDLSHSLELGSQLTLASRVYGGYVSFAESSGYGESFWCVAGQDQGCHEESSARTGTFGLEMKLGADWFLDGKVVTTVGFDLREILFDSTPAEYTDRLTGAVPTTVPLPHTNTNAFLGALFVQQVWQPLPWLALNVGGRLDFQDQFGERFSPRAAVVLTPAEGTTLRLTYNEAFRAPSLYETTEFDPTYRITPQNLRPETVRSGELEVRQQLARMTISLRGYYAAYQDLIESRPATPSELGPFKSQISPTADPTAFIVNDNLTALHVLGGSIAPQLRLPMGFTLAGSLNLSRAEKADGTLLRTMPRWFGNVRVGWQESEEGLSVQWAATFAGQRPVLNNAEAIDANVGPRFDQRLTVSGPISAVKGLRWRSSLGLDHNPGLPYAVAIGTNTPGGYVLYPDQPRAFGFVGVQYQVGGGAP